MINHYMKVDYMDFYKNGIILKIIHYGIHILFFLFLQQTHKHDMIVFNLGNPPIYNYQKSLLNVKFME